MKKILIILITIPLIFGCGGSSEITPNNNPNYSTFEKKFGGSLGDMGNSVQQTTDGGYIITGFTETPQNSYIYLVKTDGNGNQEWEKSFNIGFDTIFSFSEGRSVQQTTDGGYIITGNYDIHVPTYEKGTFLIKTDGNGNEQWTQTYEEGSGYSVQQTNDGGYIITGGGFYNQVDSPYNFDGFLLKTYPDGVKQWIREIGGSMNDELYSVKQTTDGGFVMIGITESFGWGTGIYLVKTDGNGVKQWEQKLGGIDSYEAYSVEQTSDGGYIMTGYIYSSGEGGKDVYLIKSNGDGVELWNKTFGGSSDDIGNSVQQTIDGGYIITGSTESFGDGSEVFLVKTDGNGNEQWNQTFGWISNEVGNSVQQTFDDGYIITGGKNGDVFLIKTDPDGNIN